MLKQPFPDSSLSSLSSQDAQRLRPPSQHRAHFNLDPSDIYHHRKSNSIGSINPILRPTSTNLETTQYLPRRKPTLSHDSSSKHLLALKTNLQEHPSTHTTHHVSTIQPKPRSSSVSIHTKPSISNLHPTKQLKSQPSTSSLRSKTPVPNDPIASTQSLLSSLNLSANTRPSSSQYYHQPPQTRNYPRQNQPPTTLRPNFVPVNVKNNNHHQLSSIGTIKHSLVESIHNLPCSLQDKLFFVAKLHAEVEAELTKLDMTPRSYSTNPIDNQSINTDDPIHLIKLSDRIKALAVSQLKQDLYR